MKNYGVKIVKKMFFIFCFFTFWSATLSAHPFYVSIFQIDFNKENQSIEISVKTFADDLLLGLKNTGVSKIYLGETKENPKTDEFIYNYLKANFKLKVNGKLVDYSFVGKEIETDVVWTFLEVEGITELNEMEVECSLLTEVQKTQSNIIQINNGDGIKSLLLNKRKTVDSIVF